MHDFFDQQYQLNYWPFYQVGLFSLYQAKQPQSNLSCVFSDSAFRFFPKAHSAHLAVCLIPVAEIGHEILKFFFGTKHKQNFFLGLVVEPSHRNQIRTSSLSFGLKIKAFWTSPSVSTFCLEASLRYDAPNFTSIWPSP